MKASFPTRVRGARARPFHGGTRDTASIAERLLEILGGDQDFLEAMLGDLAEEHRTRATRDGTWSAHWWYGREAVRSAPHLVVSTVRHASWHERGRIAACLAALLLAPTVAAIVFLDRDGPPAQIVGEIGSTNGIIVNNERPVQLAMRVLDSAGHVLPDTGVRYRWSAGVAVPVSATGVATCTKPGDAVVRVSLGPLVALLLLRCRPVHDVLATRMLHLVAGGRAEDVPFLALDADGKPVTLLRGRISVEDSTIVTVHATADGTYVLRGRAAGASMLGVRIGDRVAHLEVQVYEPARTIDQIRPGQRLAVPVHLGGGEMRRWRLPAAPERYFVTMLPDGDEQDMPRLAVTGANCVRRLDAHTFFCAVQNEASVFAYHSSAGDQSRAVSGTLALWRQPNP